MKLFSNFLLSASVQAVCLQKRVRVLTQEKISKRGGRVAGNARKEIEAETGKTVTTSQNAKQLQGVVTELLIGESLQDPDKDE